MMKDFFKLILLKIKTSTFWRNESSNIKQRIPLWLNCYSFSYMLLCSWSSKLGDVKHYHVVALGPLLLNLFVVIFCFYNTPCSNVMCEEIGTYCIPWLDLATNCQIINQILIFNFSTWFLNFEIFDRQWL
jgi:hypothetical protein